MSFEMTACTGQWWSIPRGLTKELSALLRMRSNNSLVELAALVQILPNLVSRVPGSAALLEAYDVLKSVAPGYVFKLARHPTFKYWVESTGDLLRANEGLVPLRKGLVADGPATELLTLYCQDLQRFAFTARIMAGDEFSGSLTPCHVGPIAFPGLGIAIHGFRRLKPVEIRSTKVRNSIWIVLSQGGTSIEFDRDHPETSVAAGGARLWVAPRITSSLGGGFELDVTDPYYREAWVRNEVFSDGNRAPIVTESDLGDWKRIMTEAMFLLDIAQPALAAEIGAFIDSVVPIRSPDRDKSLSVSAPEFPGAIQCTLDPAPMMGEVLVHEYRHNLLHALEELDPIFDQDSPQGGHFYSPWRDDARPLRGLLHAMFTFLGVVTYYRGLLQNADISPNNSRAARRRTAAHTKRLELSTVQIKAAKLTEFGTGFLNGLLAGIGEATEFARTLDGPDTQDAVDAVLKHAAARTSTASA